MLKLKTLLAALLCVVGATGQMRDLPPLEGPRLIETAFEEHEGRWHKWDNFGDGQLLTVVEGDAIRWVAMMRMAMAPRGPGGAFWTKPYAGDPTIFENWAGNTWEPISSAPGTRPYSHGNIDTWHGCQDVYTGQMNWIAGIKPGYRAEWAKLTGNPNWQRAAGVVFSLQRWTQQKFHAGPENFTLVPELWLTPHPDAPWEHPVFYKGTNSYWGGVAEGAVLVDTYNFEEPIGVGFYTAKTREEPDAFGVRHRSRIGRYAFYLEGPNAYQPVRLPAPGPESYVWDPIRDGAGGKYGDTNETAIFGTANRIAQQSVFMNPYDGYYHLLLWNSIPNTGKGKANAEVGLAHYWSPNQGLNWFPDSGNPLIRIKDWLPDVPGVANRSNSPHGYINPWTGEGYVIVWANPDGRQNHRGTRLWAFTFTVPGLEEPDDGDDRGDDERQPDAPREAPQEKGHVGLEASSATAWPRMKAAA